jgi:hypothetical protein
MTMFAIVLMVIGAIGAALYFTGMVPGALINVPFMAWAIVFGVGFVLWMFSRRARD